MEDIQFSLGLEGTGLALRLEQEEQRTKAALDRIASHFAAFKSSVDKSSEFGTFLKNADGTKKVTESADKAKQKIDDVINTLNKLLNAFKLPGAQQNLDILRQSVNAIQKSLTDLGNKPVNFETQTAEAKLRNLEKRASELMEGGDSAKRVRNQGESIDKAHLEALDEEKNRVSQLQQMYARMFDDIDAREKKRVRNSDETVEKAHLEAIDEEKRRVQGLQDMYARMFAEIEKRDQQRVRTPAEAIDRAHMEALDEEKTRLQELIALEHKRVRDPNEAVDRAHIEALEERKRRLLEIEALESKRVRTTGEDVERAHVAALDEQIERTTKDAERLNKILSGPLRSQGLQLVDDLLKEIDKRIAEISKRPLTIKTQAAADSLTRLKTQLTEAVSKPAVPPASKFSLPTDKIDKARLSGETFNQVFQRSAGILRNVSTVLSTIGVGGGIFALIYGFKQLVKDGIEFNSQVEQAKISLASLVQASAEKIAINGEEYQGMSAIFAVQGNINKLVEQLKLDALFVNGTFQDLLGIAKGITPQVLRMGGDLAQVEKLTRLTGVAASVLGVSFQEAETGLSQLLNNSVILRNEFTKKLPIGMEELKSELNASTNKAETLIKVLGKFAPAADLIRQTFTATKESLRDLLERATGEAFKPLENRLNHAFQSILKNAIVEAPDGTVNFSDKMGESIARVSALVDLLSSKMTRLFNDITGGHKKSFLDLLEEVLPNLLDGLGTLLRTLNLILSPLIEHAAIIIRLIELYAGFRIATGVWNSLLSVLKNVGIDVKALRTAFNEMEAAAVKAGDNTKKSMYAAMAAAEKFGVALKAAFASLGITALIALIGDVALRFVEAQAEAKNFAATLQEINNANFDNVIAQLNAINQKIKEGESFWGRYLRLLNFDETAFGQKQGDQAVKIIDGIKGELQAAAKELKVFSKETLSYAEIGKVTKDVIDATTKAMRDAPKRITDPEAQRAELAKLRKLKETADIAAAAVLAVEKGQKLNPLYAKYPALQEIVKSADDARKSQIELPEQATITPKAGTQKEADDKAARRQESLRDRLLQAVKQSYADQYRVLDDALAAEHARLEEQVAQNLRTQQNAAQEELAVVKDFTKRKKELQEQEFKDVINARGLDPKFLDEIGIKSADELFNTSQAKLNQKQVEYLRKYTAKPGGVSENDTKQAERGIHQFSLLLDIVTRLTTANERLNKAEAEAGKTTAVASRTAAEFGEARNNDLEKRRQAYEAEKLAIDDSNTALDARLDREAKIIDALYKQDIAEINARRDQNIRETNKQTGLTSAQKEVLNQKEREQALNDLTLKAQQRAVELVQKRAEVLNSILSVEERLAQIQESEAQAYGEILGSDNILVQQKRNKALQSQIEILKHKEKAARDDADSLEDVHLSNAAAEQRASADAFHAQADALKVQQATTVQLFATGFGQLAGLLGQFNETIGKLFDTIAKTGQIVGSVGKLSNLGTIFSQTKKEAGGGVSGSILGGLAVAEPLVGVATTALGLFESFFDMFNKGARKLLEKASEEVNKTMNKSLNDLRVGREGLGTTIATLEEQKAHIEEQFPEKHSTSFGWFFLSPIAYAGKKLADRSFNNNREDSIENAEKELQDRIDQLTQDAEDSLFKLRTETLPMLRVTPEAREYEQMLADIGKELRDLADTPGITQNELNELFNIRLLDTKLELDGKITDAKQQYLAVLKEERDVLKQEADLNKQLLDLDKSRADVLTDFKQQRNELLGLTTRDKSRTENLADLAKDRDARLQEIDEQKQALADQQHELENRRDLLQAEKDAYAARFGIVQDIGKYERDLQDELFAKQVTQLDALLDYWNQVKELMSQPLEAFIGAFKVDGARAEGGPVKQGRTYLVGEKGPELFLAGTGGFIVPNKIEMPRTSAPLTSQGMTSNVTYVFDAIHVNGNMTPGQVRDQVVEGLRRVQQDNVRRGLAFA